MFPRPKLPPKGQGQPNQIKSFFDDYFRRDTPYRIRLFRLWEKIRLYKQGYQWLEEDDDWDDPTHTPFWRPIQADASNWRPMPVQNEMVAPLQNETARLMGAGSRPYVRPSDSSPKSTRGAKMSRDVLFDLQERLGWVDIEYAGCSNMSSYGTWVLWTFWDVDFTKLVQVPVTTGAKCPDPGCDFRLADTNVPEPMARDAMTADLSRFNVKELRDKNNPLNPPKYKVAVTHCLQCQAPPGPAQLPTDQAPEPTSRTSVMGSSVDDPSSVEPATSDTAEGSSTGGSVLATPPAPWEGPPEVKPWAPDREEMGGTDFFGRPLAESVPLGDVGCETIIPFEYFPSSGGLGQTARSCREHGIAKIYPIEWIKAHFANGKDVKPQSVEELIRWHPVIGGTSPHFGAGQDPQLLTHHAEVRFYFRDPEIQDDGKPDLGRACVMAGNTILLDDDFMIPSDVTPGKTLARAMFWSCPWEVKDGELFGLGAAELMLSQQDTVNTRLAQVIDNRHRFGSPKILLEEGADLTYAGFADTGYPSDVWYYTPGPTNEKPTLFGNVQMGAGWQAEQKMDIEAIARTVGTMDIEIGAAPGNDITAASALMFMGEKAGERRKPRVARIKDLKRRSFSHMLELVHEKYREPRLLRVRGKNNQWTIREFMGEQLAGQTDVIVEDEPMYDVRMVRRETIKDALKMGTIQADTVGAKRKINEALDVPIINEEENLQVDNAQEEWLRFYEDGHSPVVKVRDDAHGIHFQQHSIDWHSDDAKRMRDAVDWNQIELALWGWQEAFQVLMKQEAMLKLNPPPAQPPAAQATPDPMIPGKLTEATPQAQQAIDEQWQAQVQLKQKIDAMPKATELRLVQAWTNMLKVSGLFGPPPAPAQLGMPSPVPPPLDKKTAAKLEAVQALLRFKAHIECHYQLAGAQATAAAAGAMMPAPSGAPETPGGMIPGPASTSTPGAGSGQGAMTASGNTTPVAA